MVWKLKLLQVLTKICWNNLVQTKFKKKERVDLKKYIVLRKFTFGLYRQC